jgi:tetratricopeptide (TPR) repeat protein/TolB-like protein
MLSDPAIDRLQALMRDSNSEGEDRYELLSTLGRGGMGTVYLAHDRKHGRRVAIKVLPRDLAAAIGPERFRREIAIAARLTHPNIMPLHDSGQVAGVPYYVMPYLEGETLGRRLGRSPALTVGESIAIAREVADALAYAHGHGIVHRDVKPDNIFLHQGHALLADFGVAKRVGEDSVTDSGLAIGTVAYASPEQAAGSREVDPRSDVYSLGCVLYRMLLPMGTEEASSSGPLERRFTESPPPIRRVRPEVPVVVDSALGRALAPRPADRFADGAEFARALSSGDASARMPSRIGRRALLVGLVSVALLATAGMLLTRRWARPAVVPDPKGVVVAGFENRTGDRTLDAVGDIASDYIARGVAATGVLHEVYDSRAAALEAGSEPRPGPGPARQLARRMGVGLVLWGSYYLRQDSLHFEAQLVDATSGRMLLALAPVAGARTEETRVVELLRQRVMAGLAVAVSPAFSSWQDPSVPPTYDAYREMLAADEAGWTFDFGNAAEHFRRAAELDTTYVGARTGQAAALALAGECGEVRTIQHRFDGRLTSLSPVQRAQLDWARATCDGDVEEQYRASTAALAAAPRSLGATILASIAAGATNRPRTNLAILRQFDARKLELSGNRLAVYMDWLSSAYRAVGDYRSSLAVAREGLRDVPGYMHLENDVAWALGALGDTTAADSVARGWLAQPPGDHGFPGQQVECLALELRAHGHRGPGGRLMAEADQWFVGNRFDQAWGSDRLPCLWEHFTPAYYLGDWARARDGYRRRLGHERNLGDEIVTHAALGAVAIRLGDRGEAERMDQWLARHPSGSASFARARLAVLRGDYDEAIRLLRRAFDEGHRKSDHIDPDLEPLRSDSAYRELYRPRD